MMPAVDVDQHDEDCILRCEVDPRDKCRSGHGCSVCAATNMTAEHNSGEHADYIVTECPVCVTEAQSLGMEVPQ